MNHKEKPVCPECPDGTKYSVQKHGPATMTQLMTKTGVWDEEGNYHEPINPNQKEQEYRCSNGHTWTETERFDQRYDEKVQERKDAGVWNE